MAGKQQGRRHTGRNAGLVILAVIIIVAVYFYFAFLSGGIVGAVVQGSKNPSQFGSIILQKINSNPKLTLSYVGYANFSPDPPFYLSFLKYHNDTRVALTLVNFPHIGNLSAVGISLDNGTTVYVCYGLNGAGYTCHKATGSPTQIVKNLTSAFSLSSFANAHIKSVLPSYYNGMPCFAVSGNGTIYGATQFYTGSNASVAFSACISSSLYIPYIANVTITPPSGGPITIALHAVNVSTTSNESAVTSLPGPVSP